MSLRMSSLDDVIALYAAAAKVTITSAQVQVSAPLALTGDPSGNTQVKLTAVNGSGYAGQFAYKYNRIDLAQLPYLLWKGPQFDLSVPLKVNDVLTAFREQTGIFVDTGDFENRDLDNVNKTMTLKALSTSKRWIGQCVIPIRDLPDFSIALFSDHIYWS